MMQEEESREWWKKQLIPPGQGHGSILWDVYEGYRKLTPRWRHTWSVKYGAGILPTRRNMKIRRHIVVMIRVVHVVERKVRTPFTFSSVRTKIYKKPLTKDLIL